MKNETKPLLISMVLISVLIVGIGVVAGSGDLHEEDLKGDKEFEKVEIGDMIVYWQQRMIDDAIVEGDYIVYQFDKGTRGLLKEEKHWRSDLPDPVIPKITKEQAESIAGGGSATLYFISPESDGFPLDPTPENPCWVVRSVDNGKMIVTIIDAVEGKILGYGVPPPQITGFSLSGPQNHTPCVGVWTAWYQNAESWFNTMGYPTEAVVWPTEAKVQSHIQSTETAMFYELAHGGSYSFASGCIGGTTYEGTTASEIKTWITGFTKMPFTFIGSCGGMCYTTDGTLSYEFRKGSMDDTVTVGYCGMGTTPCNVSCWGTPSKLWQDALFNYMNQSWTVKAAFNQALADYPMCVNCMRFAGDENLKVVPTVTRGALPVADAGPDQTVEQDSLGGASVTLDGSGSSDPDGDLLTYTWTWAGGSATGVNPTIWLPLGITTITLTVSDGDHVSEPDTVDITVVDTTPPSVDAGSDITVEQATAAGTEVTLSATISDICDASPTVTWGQGPTAVFPLGSITVTVTATDDSGNSASDTVVVNVVDTTPPDLTIPSDVTVEQASAAGTVVPLTATATDTCDTDVEITSDELAIYPLGDTTVTFTATDDSGNSISKSMVVHVVDTTPPDISVTVSPDMLWHPNHKMADITASVTVSDICDAAPTVVLASVTSNEPDNAKGNGDGNTVNDIQGADIRTEDYEFQLRAERAGKGDGRIYTIVYMVTDASGNSASASATVVVPHDMG